MVQRVVTSWRQVERSSVMFVADHMLVQSSLILPKCLRRVLQWEKDTTELKIETLDLLKVNLRNRVVFGGQDKLLHTPRQISSEEFCALHWCKYGRDNNKSMKKRHVVMCSYCMVHFWIPCFGLFHKQITVKEL